MRVATRVVIWPLLTTGCAFLGTFAYCQLGRSNRLFWEPVIFVAVLSAIAVAPMALLLPRSGWRIVDEDDATELAPPRLTLKRLLAIVTIVAVVVALGMLLDFPHRDSLLFPTVVVLVTVISGVLILNIMSSFPIRYVWPISLLLPFVVAATIMLGFSYVAPRSGRQPALFQAIFLPTFNGCSYATCLLLLAASYLRWRGILFRFGGDVGVCREMNNRPTYPS